MGLKGLLWQEEAHLDSSGQQPSSSLWALSVPSCPKEGGLPCQILIPIPEPWDRLLGTWWGCACSDPCTGTGAGLQP